MDLNKAISLDSSKSEFFFNRALTKVLLEDDMGALNDYTKVIKIDSTYINAYINRGDIKLKLKDYKAANADYTYILKYTPNDIQILMKQALTDEKTNNKVRAKEDYDKVKMLSALVLNSTAPPTPQDTSMSSTLRLIAASMNTFIEKNSKDTAAYALRGDANLLLRNFADAVNDYNKVVDLHDIRWDIFDRRGLAKFQLGNYESAFS